MTELRERTKSQLSGPKERHFSSIRMRLKMAFTLIELLVVISIIALLAAVTIPGLSRLQSSADSTVCSSNLQQIGRATLLYCNDHDGYLPGPVYGSQWPWYSQASNQWLPELLAPYLQYSSNYNYSQLFMCPAAIKASSAGQYSYSYFTQQTYNGKPYNSPFGDYGTATPPCKLINISHPSDTWALIDFDQQFPWSAMALNSPGYNTTLPAFPSHRNYRNAVYFDGHVDQIATNNITAIGPF
jgi:prepilin-type N-terminal cleavage/methylation domain-containing protein/prepilin-type processing-associated H-X9-DG protein